MMAFVPRRFRFMVATAVGRWFLRRLTGRSVDAATNELADKLPDRVVKAADALPGDVMRAGGATLAASRVAAKGIKITSKAAKDQTQRNLDEIRGDIAIETEQVRRSLWSDFLRFNGRDEEATNALLDLRVKGASQADPRGAFKNVPRSVAAGRKLLSRTEAEPIPRVQRTYRRAKKPWD
jgi:hypothetical protein